MMTVTFLPGDCLESLRGLADDSVHCCITSPPYYGLRDYGTGTWIGGDPGCKHSNGGQAQVPDSKYLGASDTIIAGGNRGGKRHCVKCGAVRQDDQIGLEETPEQYVDRLVAVFAEVHRVLREDGTLWLNIGDSYSRNPAKGGSEPGGKNRDVWGYGGAKRALTQGSSDNGVRRGDRPAIKAGGAKEKDLIGIPWMLAFALREAGWYLRQDNIWQKPNPMPESVRDRNTKSHEYVFMFTKTTKYYFDSFANSEPAVTPAGTKGAKGSRARAAEIGVSGRPPEYAIYDGTRNRRSVWSVQTKPFAGAHFATFPVSLIEPLVAVSVSDKGYCAACGAPYQRIVSREAEEFDAPDSKIDRYGSGKAGIHRAIGGAYDAWNKANPKQTIGWEKTCDCPTSGTIRGVVLDPFGGAGTVALVAEAAGHNSILCELNPKYIRIAKRRLNVPLSLQEKIAELTDAVDVLNTTLLETCDADSL